MQAILAKSSLCTLTPAPRASQTSNITLSGTRQRRVLGIARAVADPPAKKGGAAYELTLLPPLLNQLLADLTSAAVGTLLKPGVLERPDLNRSPEIGQPSTQEGFGSGDVLKEKKLGGGNFRVLLLDDERHTEPLVVRVLQLVVPDVDEDKARNAFNTSRQLGQAIITTALKEHAEFYAAQIFKQGVRATIEPDSTTL